MKQIEKLTEQYWNKILEYRRWLHVHPELSGQEKETGAYVAQKLREMGLTPTEHVGGYGVTAVIEGALPGKCVGIRADFDALAVTEQTGLPYASENPGVCHACGHDTHAAMLLGVAHILMDMRDQIKGSVKLIFQPSEENSATSGAKAMIADGVLENPKVDAVLAQHINPLFPFGKVMMADGVITAGSDKFFITIKGKSCHASKPDMGIDAIAIGAQIVSALQTIVSRNVSPLDSAVITVGKFHSGAQYNAVAETCEMEGTCRNLNPEVRNKMPQRMENIIRGIAEGMGATYTFRYVMGYDPLYNDPGVCSIVRRTAREVLGEEYVGEPANRTLGGEDFSFFAQKVPCAYYYIGCQHEDQPFWPLHNGHFNPDEDAMKSGIRVMAASALNFLAENN